MNRSIHAISVLAIASTLIGCSSSRKSTADPPVRLGAASSLTLPRNRLANTENGLELRRWTILDEPGRVVRALAVHVDGQAVDETTQQRLKRNGLRFVRVPVEKLDTLLDDLGGATVNTNEWHGQAPEWRSIQDRPVDSRGRAVALDGYVRRYDRGEFRLMMRGWSVQMEDGPCVHLEMLPLHARPQATNWRVLMGEENKPGEGFATMSVDIQLQPGFAYVLLSESPQIDWPGLDAPLPAPGKAAPNAAAAMVHAPRVGPMDSIGPAAPTPSTVGEILLPTDRDPATRSVLVFLPHVAPELFPAETAASMSYTQGSGG